MIIIFDMKVLLLTAMEYLRDECNQMKEKGKDCQASNCAKLSSSVIKMGRCCTRGNDRRTEMVENDRRTEMVEVEMTEKEEGWADETGTDIKRLHTLQQVAGWIENHW